MNYSWDAKFEGNILVVGRTGCGKTTFVQNLRKNKMFGEIKQVTWLSKYHFQGKGKTVLEVVLSMKKLALNTQIL